MTTFEILLAILVAVNALAFMYFMYVDQKATARSDNLNQRLDNSIVTSNTALSANVGVLYDAIAATNQRLDDLYRELISLRKDMK